MEPTRSRAYLLTEVKLGRPLAKYLREQRAAGESWQAIAFDLHELIGMRITGETLRTWAGTKAKKPAKKKARIKSS